MSYTEIYLTNLTQQNIVTHMTHVKEGDICDSFFSIKKRDLGWVIQFLEDKKKRPSFETFRHDMKALIKANGVTDANRAALVRIVREFQIRLLEGFLRTRFCPLGSFLGLDILVWRMYKKRIEKGNALVNKLSNKYSIGVEKIEPKAHDGIKPGSINFAPGISTGNGMDDIFYMTNETFKQQGRDFVYASDAKKEALQAYSHDVIERMRRVAGKLTPRERRYGYTAWNLRILRHKAKALQTMMTLRQSLILSRDESGGTDSSMKSK